MQQQNETSLAVRPQGTIYLACTVQPPVSDQLKYQD